MNRPVECRKMIALCRWLAAACSVLADEAGIDSATVYDSSTMPMGALRSK